MWGQSGGRGSTVYGTAGRFWRGPNPPTFLRAVSRVSGSLRHRGPSRERRPSRPPRSRRPRIVSHAVLRIPTLLMTLRLSPGPSSPNSSVEPRCLKRRHHRSVLFHRIYFSGPRSELRVDLFASGGTLLRNPYGTRVSGTVSPGVLCD